MFFTYKRETFATRPKVSVHRRLALVATGGCLLQLTGCASGLAPVLISFIESAVLGSLLGLPAGP